MDRIEIWQGSLHCIHGAQEKVLWLAFVNTVMTFGFYKRRRVSCPDVRLLTSQEELCSVELIGSIIYAHISEFELRNAEMQRDMAKRWWLYGN
jgi:hypothetical protein